MTNRDKNLIRKNRGFLVYWRYKIPGGSSMAFKYTQEKLKSLDKEMIIQLFLSQQEQLEKMDHTLQLV